jgi:nucleotide-binding universal stress UspA family protein
MHRIQSIVAATDFSDEARYAADRAAMVAMEQHAQLSLLHIIDRSALNSLGRLSSAPSELEAKLIDDARSTLNEWIADISRKIPVQAIACVKTGRVLDEIVAASETADLLVLGAHGTNFLRSLIIGATTKRLLRTCTRPVLVVKNPSLAEYSRIIVPVDFLGYSVVSVEMAGRVSSNARITIVHAFRVPFEGRLRIAGASDASIRNYYEAEQADAVKKIASLIRNCCDDVQRISSTVEVGDASRVILAKEQEFAADLIVMGKRGQSMVEELFLGSVTSHVLAGSTCDILVMPYTEAPAGSYS